MSMVRKALASEYGYRASVLGEAAAPEEGLAEGRALVERAIKAKAKFLTMPKGTRNAPLFMEGAGGLRLELRAAPAALTDWSRTFVALRMSYPLVTAGPEGSDADAKGREAAYAAEVKALFKRLEAPLAELAQPGDANPAGPPLATYAKQVVRDCSRLALEAVRSGEAGRAGEVVGHMALAVCRGLSEGPDSQALKALRALALDLGERRNRFIWRRALPGRGLSFSPGETGLSLLDRLTADWHDEDCVTSRAPDGKEALVIGLAKGGEGGAPLTVLDLPAARLRNQLLLPGTVQLELEHRFGMLREAILEAPRPGSGPRPALAGGGAPQA